MKKEVIAKVAEKKTITPKKNVKEVVEEKNVKVEVEQKKKDEEKAEIKETKSKKKKLCKMVKKEFLKDDFEKFKSLVDDSKWICKKCGRTANEMESLCKPISIK